MQCVSHPAVGPGAGSNCDGPHNVSMSWSACCANVCLQNHGLMQEWLMKESRCLQATNMTVTVSVGFNTLDTSSMFCPEQAVFVSGSAIHELVRCPYILLLFPSL